MDVVQLVIRANIGVLLGVGEGVLVTDGVAVIEIVGVGVGDGQGLSVVHVVHALSDW